MSRVTGSTRKSVVKLYGLDLEVKGNKREYQALLIKTMSAFREQGIPRETE